MLRSCLGHVHHPYPLRSGVSAAVSGSCLAGTTPPRIQFPQASHCFGLARINHNAHSNVLLRPSQTDIAPNCRLFALRAGRSGRHSLSSIPLPLHSRQRAHSLRSSERLRLDIYSSLDPLQTCVPRRRASTTLLSRLHLADARLRRHNRYAPAALALPTPLPSARRQARQGLPLTLQTQTRTAEDLCLARYSAGTSASPASISGFPASHRSPSASAAWTPPTLRHSLQCSSPIRRPGSHVRTN